MRRRVIAALENVQNARETRAFFLILPLVAGAKYCDIVVAPPFTAISTAVEAGESSSIAIAAKNVSWSKKELHRRSFAPMLAEAGCGYVIIGHSERRQLFRETDENVQESLMALESGLTPLSAGETQEDRDAGLLSNDPTPIAIDLNGTRIGETLRHNPATTAYSERRDRVVVQWP